MLEILQSDQLLIEIILVPNIPTWPRFSSQATNFVFRLPRDESYVESDDYRVAGMQYINSIAR